MYSSFVYYPTFHLEVPESAQSPLHTPFPDEMTLEKEPKKESTIEGHWMEFLHRYDFITWHHRGTRELAEQGASEMTIAERFVEELRLVPDQIFREFLINYLAISYSVLVRSVFYQVGIFTDLTEEYARLEVDYRIYQAFSDFLGFHLLSTERDASHERKVEEDIELADRLAFYLDEIVYDYLIFEENSSKYLLETTDELLRRIVIVIRDSLRKI